ncbi:MAG: hypothetical protein ITG00_12385 [Flavobacterium sp.]|nr:hypothetical protein [Flavobacterium sp.]
MNRIFVLFFFFFGLTTMNSQIHEIGVFLGGSNYIGEIGPMTHIAPKEPTVGLLYKWNRSPRHAWRFSATQAKVSSADADAKSSSRNERGYSFENTITEVSAGMEFNFFDFNLHELRPKFTPYVYTGASYFAYNELYIVGGETREDYREGALAIPMIVGVKSNITSNFVLGFEVGARYTFTDNIDGSNPKNENLVPLQFGNINSNDWYVFTGLTLTYTFGEKPCYCAE